MTRDLFRQDAYLLECSATAAAITPQGSVTKIEKKSASTRRVMPGFAA
ncbi:hypothetical protein [Rhodoferax sp. UBA5149]|nr:hypothetical protein [Rhodoferax sp. UBA5149]